MDMDELNKGLGISMRGPVRDEIVRGMRRQVVDGWGIALPPVDPLVLDFGLGAFDRYGLVEYWIANEAAAGYCGKYLFVFDGQSCPRHRHRTKHETFFLVAGRLEVQWGDRKSILDPGGTLPIPAGVPHEFKGAGPALLLELSMPCEIDDNLFDDPRIPIGGNHRSGGIQPS